MKIEVCNLDDTAVNWYNTGPYRCPDLGDVAEASSPRVNEEKSSPRRLRHSKFSLFFYLFFSLFFLD
ncbi:hypothetical protein BHE74_00056538 [Ensete ventricosum]|nr:hypothetical protein BHE74_00056538 [Ensete ventricosum]